MYSVDNLCPSGILSSSKRQLCFHQEPFLKSPEHQKCGRLGTGAVPQAGLRVGTPIPRAGGRTDLPTLPAFRGPDIPGNPLTI